ncbi:MAG: hypothetical protein ACOYKD_10685, partial [Anaerolineaceae bacterium]
MQGEQPDRVPLLIFSELLPDNIYEKLIKPAGGGLIIHAGSVYPKRQRVLETNEYVSGLRIQRLHTSKRVLQAVYRTHLNALLGNGEVQIEWFIKSRQDYPSMIEALEDTEFFLDESALQSARQILGNEGVTHTWCDEPPYMGLQYLLGYEAWSLHQYDYPDEFIALMDSYSRMQQKRMLLQVQASEKDLINLGNLGFTEQPLVSRTGSSIDHHPMLPYPQNRHHEPHGPPAKEAQKETPSGVSTDSSSGCRYGWLFHWFL